MAVDMAVGSLWKLGSWREWGWCGEVTGDGGLQPCHGDS